jgi:hypothetical protein
MCINVTSTSHVSLDQASERWEQHRTSHRKATLMLLTTLSERTDVPNRWQVFLDALLHSGKSHQIMDLKSNGKHIYIENNCHMCSIQWLLNLKTCVHTV